MPTCKGCNVEYLVGTLFCKECGIALFDPIIKIENTQIIPVSASLNGQHANNSLFANATNPEARNRVLVVIPSSGREIGFELQRDIRIGRIDHKKEQQPDLDLTDDKGIECGVSRDHALLKKSEQDLVLVDLGSTNGTHLNGKSLSPNEPYQIHNGDAIRFGSLLVRVFFEAESLIFED